MYFYSRILIANNLNETNMKILAIFPTILLSFICYGQQDEYSKSQIIVELKENYTSKVFCHNTMLLKINDSLQLKGQKIIGNKKIEKTYLLEFNNEIDVKSVIEVYKRTNLFRYVEPNYIGHGHGISQTTPNDPLFLSRQWSHFNNGSFALSPSTNDADIDTDLAWDITQGDPELIVAILDSGIKITHPEFANRIGLSYNFVANTNNPADDHGHGTNVAGIALAKGNNSVGYAGVNWNSRIMICKVINNKNMGYYSWWVDGIYFAVDNGAKVINMSLGGNSSSTSLEDAVNYAFANNVAVVVSAGNQNGVIQYPAQYENAICVGATSSNDRRTVPFPWGTTSGSNYGPELDLVAPGNFIYGLSAASNSDYNTYWSGTSQAAPHVTGVISLMLSINPALTVTQIRTILQESLEDQVGDAFDTPGWDQYYGWGRLNAFSALSNPLLSQTTYYKESKNLKLYPNPINSDNTFTISGLEVGVNYDIKLISLEGKIIEEVKTGATDGMVSMNSKAMQSGVYFVQIQNLNDKLLFSKKLVKK